LAVLGQIATKHERPAVVHRRARHGAERAADRSQIARLHHGLEPVGGRHEDAVPSCGHRAAEPDASVGRDADEVERTEDAAVWRGVAGTNRLAQRTAGPDVESHVAVVEDGGEGDLPGAPGGNVVVELCEAAAARRALAGYRDDRGRRAATLE